MITADVSYRRGKIIPLKESADKALEEALKQKVVDEIGSFAKPAKVYLVDALPRTRSGKIIRRMLREITTTGTIKGDTTRLEDAEVLDQLLKDLKLYIS